MDSSVFKHSNLLLLYGIQLKNSYTADADNLKAMRSHMDMLFKFKLMKIDAKLKNSSLEEREILQATARELRSVYAKLKNSNNIYELIYYYIKYSYEEQLESIKRKDEISTKKDELKYAYEQFQSPAEIKKYVEVILPLMEHVDLDKIQKKNARKQQIPNGLKYAVSMYKTPRLLINDSNETEALRVYSFGWFQYKTNILGESMPFEILGVVKKYPDGTTKSNSVIMHLPEVVELEVYNMDVRDESKIPMPFKISVKDTESKKPSIVYKRKPADIPNDAIEFFKNIVFSDFILANALTNNSDFIGSIVECQETQGRYGKYSLSFDELRDGDIISILEYAKENPGILKGIDTTFYGNDLKGVLLMVKYAALAIGERLECKEKEIGITQGEE